MTAKTHPLTPVSPTLAAALTPPKRTPYTPLIPILPAALAPRSLTKVEPYKPANRYSPNVSIAAAAIDWQQVSPALIATATVTAGIPSTVDAAINIELQEKIDAILEALKLKELQDVSRPTGPGSEFQSAAPTREILLSRTALAKWIGLAEARAQSLTQTKPAQTAAAVFAEFDELLNQKEVLARLKIGASTLQRWRDAGSFPEPTHTNPLRWPASAVIEKLESTRRSSPGSAE
jgi:predicted DNA-binding transcriptional regulator AlpA